MANTKELPTVEQAIELLEPIERSVVDQAVLTTVNINYGVVHPMGIASNRSGSGIHIGNGRIITAEHTIRAADKGPISVYSENESEALYGNSIFLDRDRDLGIIQADSLVLPQAEIEPMKLDPYQTVLITASPTQYSHYSFRGLYLGDIVEFDPDATADLRDAFLFYDSIDSDADDAAIRHGASGGGVFNTQGQLVGMVFGRITDGRTQGLAVKGATIYSALEQLENK